jgi:hypothetical protein
MFLYIKQNILLNLLLFFFLKSMISTGWTQVPVESEVLFTKGVRVDLRDPEYCEGILKTESGGVISAPDIRLQAKCIIYKRKLIDGAPVFTIEAEEDLLLEFGEYLFVGKRLEYDFQSKKGIIYEGRSALEPWFFGGQIIHLEPDSSYYIEEAFATTSENYKMEWQIKAQEAIVDTKGRLKAKNVQFRFFDRALFWLPSFQTNLNSIFESPLRYNFRWWGRQGPRVSMIYEIFSWQRFKAFVRLDWRLNRGLGIGFETHYRSQDRKEKFDTINFLAQDSAIAHPNEHLRYRYQGLYSNLLDSDRLSISLTWDKLSDKYMATDYKDKGLELDTAGRTQAHIRLNKFQTVSNFFTRVRANPFQTVKQELPTFETHFYPINISKMGIIADCEIKASYLNFKYSDSLINVHDYASTRVEINQIFYKPYNFGYFTITPEVGGQAIYYGNSPQGISRWLAFGKFSLEVNSRIYKNYSHFKHVITPYASYSYYTYPSTEPNHHYIFNIDDGWYRLNMIRFGVSQSFYYRQDNGCISRFLYADIFANAFFKTQTIPQTVPKVYGSLIFKSFSFLQHSVLSGWDFEKSRLDHLNIKLGWTVSNDLAITAEYRHRDSFDWRKADHTNFIIDSFRSLNELRHSQLSDRRDTLLIHFFYRINPNWAIEFQSRQGWNRLREPKYIEFEIDLLATLRSAWHFKWSYRYREDDKFRVSASLNIGINKPDQKSCQPLIPCLEF